MAVADRNRLAEIKHENGLSCIRKIREGGTDGKDQYLP
jgi:hypothetical protein